MRARIASNDGDQVGPLVDGKSRSGQAPVSDNRPRWHRRPTAWTRAGSRRTPDGCLGQVDRSDKALVQPVRLKLLVGHHAIALAKDVLGLAVIELVVARDNGHDWLALGIDQRQRLSRTVLGEAKELGNGSMVPMPGVSTLVSVPSPGPSVTTTLVLAASSSAAKPQSSQ